MSHLDATRGGVRVKTTLPYSPYPPNASRKPIKTARLILRPFTQDDTAALHVLRTQPEVMQWTLAGRPDVDIAETQTRLDRFLAPNDARTFNYAICLASTGELIGMGGNHGMSSDLGWPELGYMLRREHWGQGYATEVVRGFLESWWALDREEVELQVDPTSVADVAGEKVHEGVRITERLVAVVEKANVGSLRVMEKVGLRAFKEWTEPDTCTEGQTNTSLVAYMAENPKIK
ncbi:GNAT domain-containing protein [Xylariales sp. PMI_506]|nr:GNAT domain-containing protein [Xylariales sp. PMI_506]